MKGSIETSCDLLKIHYLCGWNDNMCLYKERYGAVVICSKFITFVVEMTTFIKKLSNSIGLWFAQNSLPLWLKWQHARTRNARARCCDLLKIHYLCGWNDNRVDNIKKNQWVVICSKFITFVVEMTTTSRFCLDSKVLWFAQNSLPLWLKWQRKSNMHILFGGCDLLKIHYLCGWNDNRYHY